MKKTPQQPTPNHPFSPDCELFSDTRPIILLKDKRGKSEYRANNPTHKIATALQVDACITRENNLQKCDFLLLDEQERIAHFIELKGQDLATGIEQLIASVNLLFEQLQNDYQYKTANAKLVVSRTPKILPAQKWIALRKLLQSYNGDAYRQNSPFMDQF